MSEIHITEIKVQNMEEIDLSSDRRYSLVINGQHRLMMKTDGFFKPHLTKKQWVMYAIQQAIDEGKIKI